MSICVPMRNIFSVKSVLHWFCNALVEEGKLATKTKFTKKLKKINSKEAKVLETTTGKNREQNKTENNDGFLGTITKTEEHKREYIYKIYMFGRHTRTGVLCSMGECMGECTVRLGK